MAEDLGANLGLGFSVLSENGLGIRPGRGRELGGRVRETADFDRVAAATATATAGEQVNVAAMVVCGKGIGSIERNGKSRERNRRENGNSKKWSDF